MKIKQILMIIYTILIVLYAISYIMYPHWFVAMFLGLAIGCYVQLFIDYLIDRKDGKFI